MKEVINMQNNQQYTIEELEQFVLGNIEHYEDFEEYSKDNDTSLEEFEDYKERGFINEITCGTYNGATDEFTPWEINNGNLIDTIIQDIWGGDLQDSLEDYVEGTRYIDYVLAYVEIYKVFTIGEKVYVDLD